MEPLWIPNYIWKKQFNEKTGIWCTLKYIHIYIYECVYKYMCIYKYICFTYTYVSFGFEY